MALFGTIVLGLAALASSTTPAASAGPPARFDHSAWDRILRARVSSDGRVAYRDLASKDRGALDAYLQAIATADPSTWPKKERQAFYINAYNACVVRGVLSGRTAESLTARLRFFGTDKYTVARRSLSLNDLEKEVILPGFKDPRNHFALVCASASCPRLAARAYTADALDDMLEAQGREFLADRTRNPLGPGPRVEVSMIFKWYASDFAGAAGSVAAFIAPYAGAAGPACLKTNGCEFRYVDYDWTLNAQPGQRPEAGGGNPS
jgi:hypothetical protein